MQTLQKKCQPLHSKTKHKPHKKFKLKKWYDKSCWELKKEILPCAKQVIRHPNCPITRGSLCLLRKTYKKLVKFKKNQFKNDQIEKIQSLESNNPKEYWKLVETLRSATTNKTESQSNIYPEEWFTYFKTLNNPQTGVNNPFDEGVEFFTTHSDKFSSVYIKCLDKPFDDKKLKDVSKTLKNNKASGIDAISNEMIKCFIKFHCTFFVNLFNRLLE